MSLLATITGNLIDLYGNPMNGRIALQLIYPNGNPVLPDDLRVTGTAIVATRGAASTIAGAFSVSVLGNDVVADIAGNVITYWNVVVIETGSNVPVWWGVYEFNSNGTYNLNTINPILPNIPLVPGGGPTLNFANTTPELGAVSGTSAMTNYTPNGLFFLITKNGLALSPYGPLADYSLAGRALTFTVAAVSTDVYLYWYTH